MSATMWKYEFELSDDPQPKDMPRDAQLLHVEAQDGLITLWALVVPDRKPERRSFVIHGTGHPVDPDSRYVGTALIRPFVWHLFEVQP